MDDVRRYPFKHPETPWNVEPIYVFYEPRRQEVRVSTPRFRHDALLFRPDDLPQWEWRRVVDRDKNPIPLELRRDAAGVMARWLPLRRQSD
jgi:hypothetical protein